MAPVAGEDGRRARAWWVEVLGSGALPVVVIGAILFATAGRTDLPRVWCTLVLTLIGRLGVRTLVARVDPELAYRRGHPGPGTPAWDRAWLAGFVLMALSIPAAAGLELRWHGPTMSWWLWPPGFALFCFGLGITAWAMLTNTHFETFIRIQKDRGHVVAQSGPYALARHPGYLGAISFLLCCPLMLGSWWSAAPVLAGCAWLVLRTAVEDRLLHRELEGYAAYAERVRARLVPGIW
jgi:protein-S-isoprenylcysteine O-methyltransferase Ste14